MSLVKCYIEIEKDSNIKYEFDKVQNKLVVDRILKDGFHYPYAYGFIPGTLAKDNDELDVLIITNMKVNIDTNIDGYIIGGIIMEDEKGMDEKIFIVPTYEYKYLYDINLMDMNVVEKICEFFANYKKDDDNKWSKIHGLLTKQEAIILYNSSKI